MLLSVLTGDGLFAFIGLILREHFEQRKKNNVSVIYFVLELSSADEFVVVVVEVVDDVDEVLGDITDAAWLE